MNLYVGTYRRKLGLPENDGFIKQYLCIKSVRICSYSGPYFTAFRLNTEYISVFSPNTGKYGLK